ncbi:MAG: peroxiredoxin family protein [Maribacter sp.]
MNKHLLYFFILVLAGCNQDEKKSPKVFFAGEIVNPTSTMVFLSKDDQVLDSVLLDENNRFSFDLPSIKEGLHHFNHGREYQYIFLEKGDSIQIRLNTIDFDESLVFSGIGSEINNFLLELFLANEEEESLVFSKLFNMEPADFDQQIEILHREKLKDLDELKAETELSKGEQEIAEQTINYTYYNYKEKYPFEHRKKTGKKTLHTLPENFYDYRENISFNNGNLNYLTPYYDFMKSHLNNRSYMGCSVKCGVENEKITNHLHFNRHKLNLIDSLVQETELKDNLFRNVAFDYLLMAHDTETNNETFIKDFHIKSGNNRHIKEINDLYEGIRSIQPQKIIPNVQVIDTNGNKVSLQEISKNKKVVFYFWTGANKRYFKDINRRVSQLSLVKKEYTFVGINYNTDESTWKGMVEQGKLNPANQYKSENFEALTKALVIYPLNKCIITEDAKIVNAFTTMWATNF